MKYRVVIEYQDNPNSPYKLKSEEFDDHKQALRFGRSYYPEVYVIYERMPNGRERIMDRKGKFLGLKI